MNGTSDQVQVEFHSKRKEYKLTCEKVDLVKYPEHLGSSVDQVPEECWELYGIVNSDPFEQYEGLKALMEEGKLIRNIAVYELERVLPVWKKIDDKS